MTFKEFLTSRIQLFFFLVTAILASQVILGNIIEPDRTLYYKDFIDTFLMAGLCLLPTVVTYSKKELSLKQLIIRQAIQLVLIEGIMVFISVNSIENTPQKPINVALIAIITALIYAAAILIMWRRQHREAKQLTKLLRDMQKAEK